MDLTDYRRCKEPREASHVAEEAEAAYQRAVKFFRAQRPAAVRGTSEGCKEWHKHPVAQKSPCCLRLESPVSPQPTLSQPQPMKTPMKADARNLKIQKGVHASLARMPQQLSCRKINLDKPASQA